MYIVYKRMKHDQGERKMKKIIDGKLYDTTTAEEIGAYSNVLPYNYFNCIEESLYKTSNGNFFIVGGGGAMTKYSESSSENSWGGSSDNFIPLSRAEALEWMEAHGDVEELEKHFGDLIKEA